MTKTRYYTPGGQVKVYDRGIETDGGTIVGIGRGEQLDGVKRGSIKGWSFASRRRFRQFLLHYQPRPEDLLFNVTCTIPGEVGPIEETRALWKRWRMRIDRAHFSMVWRMEVQQRGALHWHCIIAGREGVMLPGFGVEKTESWLRSIWLECLKERAKVTGAMEHACKVDRGEDKPQHQWLRYMMDHSSKSKQAQIAVGLGKHWGVIGKDRLVKAHETLDMRFDAQQWKWLLRLLQRANRPLIKDERCPFGYRHGHPCRRGKYGKAVWFGTPTIQRQFVAAAMDLAQGMATGPF